MDTSQIEQKLRRDFPELDIHVTHLENGQYAYHFGSILTMEEKQAVNQRFKEYVKEMEENKELIEQLSAAEHASWSRWMKYVFDVCDAYSIIDTDGFDRNKGVLIPPELVERWQRQIDTPYDELSEQEKQSDRDEVAHILPIIREYALSQRDDSGELAALSWGLANAHASYMKDLQRQVKLLQDEVFCTHTDRPATRNKTLLGDVRELRRLVYSLQGEDKKE